MAWDARRLSIPFFQNWGGNMGNSPAKKFHVEWRLWANEVEVTTWPNVFWKDLNLQWKLIGRKDKEVQRGRLPNGCSTIEGSLPVPAQLNWGATLTRSVCPQTIGHVTDVIAPWGGILRNCLQHLCRVLQMANKDPLELTYVTVATTCTIIYKSAREVLPSITFIMSTISSSSKQFQSTLYSIFLTVYDQWC